jgi:hypothetical protein
VAHRCVLRKRGTPVCQKLCDRGEDPHETRQGEDGMEREGEW